jgi:hypothetical protein
MLNTHCARLIFLLLLCFLAGCSGIPPGHWVDTPEAGAAANGQAHAPKAVWSYPVATF